jgi:uncharacterized membrane protein YfhO
VVVETKAEKPNQLVATWVYRRFWQAYLDGQRVPVKRSHGVFMEIDVPAGSHQVVWRYIPYDAILGCLISLSPARLKPATAGRVKTSHPEGVRRS